MAIAKIGMALSAVSAVAQIKAGQAAARAYRQQAERAKLEGRQQALEYKRKGVQVLRNIRATAATINARAAAGNTDPFSGSALSVRGFAMKAGTEDFYATRENALFAETNGILQAGEYNRAASQAKRQGFIAAIGTIGTGMMSYASIGAAPTTQVGGFAGGGSIGGAINNTLYPTTGSLGMPSMVPGG